MLANIFLFVQRLLLADGLRVSQLPEKCYRDLLTAAEHLEKESIVPIESLIEIAKACPGRLIVDDTSNPKYAQLRRLTRKLFIPKTGGYCQGYKVLLFLWETAGMRIPIAFALWHKESLPLPELALNGFSLLRNHYNIKPEAALGDAGFGSQEIIKRLTDYGWPCIFRLKKSQNLSGKPIRQLIPRGYGEITGTLENNTKVKVIRRKSHFLQCNRMTWDSLKIRNLYTIRWRIEEAFRILKSCLNLSGCQQHTVGCQVLYVLLCCVALACLELYPGMSPYEAKRAIISGELDPENILRQELLAA